MQLSFRYLADCVFLILCQTRQIDQLVDVKFQIRLRRPIVQQIDHSQFQEIRECDLTHLMHAMLTAPESLENLLKIVDPLMLKLTGLRFHLLFF